MKYFVASDHAGKMLRAYTKKLLEERGIEVVDLGCTTERADYPDYANKLCEAVLANEGSRGVLICGSGIGMSMVANRHKGIRAALCHDAYTATVARGHNNANVLCMGERVLGLGVVESIIDAWLKSEFEGGRHAERIAKF